MTPLSLPRIWLSTKLRIEAPERASRRKHGTTPGGGAECELRTPGRLVVQPQSATQASAVTELWSAGRGDWPETVCEQGARPGPATRTPQGPAAQMFDVTERREYNPSS